MAAQEIKVPDIGDFDAVEVIEVLVAEGDTVEKEQALITLESDKATLEVPSTVAGKITSLKISEGDNVSEGDVIAMVEAEDDSGSDDGDDDQAEGSDNESAEESDDSGDDTPEADDDSEDKEDAGEEEAKADDAGDGETVEVKVPDIGDFDAVEVIEVLVAEGDTVEKEQALITLESDKATLEVPSSAAGTLTELKIAEGDNVSEGDVIAMVQTAGGGSGKSESKSDDKASAPSEKKSAGGSAQADKATSDEGKKKKPESGTASQDDKPAPQADAAKPSGDDSSKLKSVDEERFGKAHASPSVRKFARELGADLGRIEGSGRKGRITEEDVQSYVKDALEQVQSGKSKGGAAAPAGGGGGVPTQPDIDFSQFGEVEITELARIRKISAKAVHKNWLLIPHVTQFDTADITEMEAFRQANKEKAKADGVKLTPLAFLLKASAAALKAFPDLNSSLTADGASLVHKKYVNIAVAVDTPGGLLMPVIKDVDKKGIYEIARDLDDVSARARDGKIKGSDMQGACFSISSLGGVGGTAFTPIVNSPEVGILGVSKHTMQPVWNGSEFEPRLILPLSFSYDHRVIDGAKAARITGFISEKLSDLRTLLL